VAQFLKKFVFKYNFEFMDSFIFIGFQSTAVIILLLKKFFLLFYYSYVHIRLGSFLPPAPTPSLTTHSAPSHSPLKKFFIVAWHLWLKPGILSTQA
jgi:hypothetical protein